ncbi:HAMP domain-containing histidine kinase [Ruegeria sediminis]|uniref:histidine kinase n=1 Tax=Ruegeria sediminis TaxID=2583820 RepID=A0ABY2WTN5_9RHOB|nr:HAMP domain-containing sensor histidine kinase [Ruegeria sediminis]TMV03816.1 HAMP domain-containing histidine kinase [Ruegeria sediminis]
MVRPTATEIADPEERETPTLILQMQDYCQVGLDLVWQRQIIYAAALALAAFYYDARLAGIVLLLIAVSEVYDFWVFKRVLSWKGNDRRAEQRFLHLLYLGALLSSSVIVSYSIGIAILQGPTTHFMSLFFLFAAALFAAMNSHHLMPVLMIRLTIFGAAFLFIPIRDIVIADAPLKSELWAQFFTSVFVLFFIIESSRVYLRFYRTKLFQMELLRSEHEKAKIAYRAKSEFVSTMSHELRTPLTAIKGSVDLANSGRLGEMPEQVSSILDVAQRNCSRLLSLINEILDLQSVEAGSMSFSRENIELVRTVSEAISDNQPYASKLGVSIRSELPDDLIWVNADKLRLLQVFANILSNAAKFSPSGSEVLVSVHANADRARVLFADNGIGLSEDDRDKVFERFTQIDSSDTRNIGGTGLGMNISKHIMDALGGSITYERNAGPGTTFVVEIPLQYSGHGETPENRATAAK